MARPRSSGIKAVRRRQPDGSFLHDWYHPKTLALIGRERDGMTRDQAIARTREDEEAPPSGPTAGTFGQLCAIYLGSPTFKKLGPKTQREYRKHIEIMRAMWEAAPVEGITRTAVRALHERFAASPFQANAILRTLRLVMNYGIHQLEWPQIVKNPALKPELYDTPARTGIWWQPQIDVFFEAAGALDLAIMRRAMALLLYTVQRPMDVLKMSRPMMWQDEAGRGWIRLRQAKTDELVDVPCHRRLWEALEGAPEVGLLLPAQKGGQWHYRFFAKVWDRIVRRANLIILRRELRARGGLPDRKLAKEREAAKAAIRALTLDGLQRRDIRRTGIVQLALAGATTPQIAALSGHSIDDVQTILDTYLPRRGEVALGGVEKWEQAPPALSNVIALPAPKPRRVN
jgi:hypothetical protein